MTFYATLALSCAALSTVAVLQNGAANQPPVGGNDSQPGAGARPPPGQNSPMPQGQRGGTSPTPTPPEQDWGNAGGVVPGFLDVQRAGGGDKTYGPAGSGADSAQSGLTVLPIEVYGEGEMIGPSLAPAFPEFHTVGAGDTLWGISARYYNDPYQWPKLWAHNGQITNANWIFPGDLIRLRDPIAETQSTQPGLSTSATTSLHFGAAEQPSAALLPQYLVNRYAFVDEKAFKSAMQIVGSAEAAVMMSMQDTAYVGYPKDTPPVAGERLAVYEVARPIYDAKLRQNGEVRRGRRIGYLVEVVGEVHVQQVAAKSAETKVVDSIRPVERGMKVGELRHRFARVRPQGSLVTANGTIVDLIGEGSVNGEYQFLIVNIGAKNGLVRGNILDVVRRGDEFTGRNLMGIPNEAGHPRRVMGELLVLEVQENVAITLAVNSVQELVVGDHVEIGKTAP